jgi:hypothetical protein
MALGDEIESLRQHLGHLAGQRERRLARRYALRFGPGERPGFYRRFRRALGDILRRLGLRHGHSPEPWMPGLQHVVREEEGRALVIWAFNVDRNTLRNACRGFELLQADLPGWAMVLVTDIADFAFYSRLGWLVEYVPALLEPAEDYAIRKKRYLAWRYRDAPALPVSVGLRRDVNVQELKLDGF